MVDTLGSTGALDVIQVACRIGCLEVDRGGEPFMREAECADGGLNGPRGTQCVAVVPLCAAHWERVGTIPEGLFDRQCLRRIVERCRASVRVDIPNLVRL